MKIYIFLFVVAVLFSSCLAQKQGPFKAENQPPAPDYSNPAHWSALPFRKDKPDIFPKYEKAVHDSVKPADVFYIYPTIYLSKKNWTADVENRKANRRIDKYPVKYQASVFNRECRVYAPRYRQAVYQSFTDKGTDGEKALAFAYEDVKRAFEYYLEHYHEGRPIIIASHSQGTYHARQLLRDYFDNQAMKEKLICAYVVGFGIYEEWYREISLCKEPDDINCYVSWSSFKKEIDSLHKWAVVIGNSSVNPVSWKNDGEIAESNGGILFRIQRKNGFRSVAQLQNHQLIVKTKTPYMRRKKILHLVDYNLFWKDIRENVSLRTREYLKRNEMIFIEKIID